MQDGAPIVGYVRVSTEEQADSGLSLDAQAEQLRAYAAAKGLNLVEVITDAGKSAGSLKRPGMKRVLAMLDAGDAAGVLVTKFDRLTRRVEDAAVLLERYFHPDREAWLIGAAEPIDTKTVSGRMVCYMLAVVAQYEREATSARNGAVLAHKRAKGQQLGHAPFGQELGPDGETLVPCPADLTTWETIRELHARDLSTREIASALTRLGYPTKRGREKWSHQAVAAILKNPPSTGTTGGKPTSLIRAIDLRNPPAA